MPTDDSSKYVWDKDVPTVLKAIFTDTVRHRAEPFLLLIIPSRPYK